MIFCFQQFRSLEKFRRFSKVFIIYANPRVEYFWLVLASFSFKWSIQMSGIFRYHYIKLN